MPLLLAFASCGSARLALFRFPCHRFGVAVPVIVELADVKRGEIFLAATEADFRVLEAEEDAKA